MCRKKIKCTNKFIWSSLNPEKFPTDRICNLQYYYIGLMRESLVLPEDTVDVDGEMPNRKSGTGA